MIYRHLKSGNLYSIIDPDARLEWDPWEPVVVYKSVDTGKVWVRRANEFFDGRFKKLENPMGELWNEIHFHRKEVEKLKEEIDNLREKCDHLWGPEEGYLYSGFYCRKCGSTK